MAGQVYGTQAQVSQHLRAGFKPAQRLFHHLFIQQVCHVIAFRGRHEDARRHVLACRVLDAHQNLKVHARVIPAQRQNLLRKQLDAIFCQRIMHQIDALHLQLTAAQIRIVLTIQVVAVASLFFGSVTRGVRLRVHHLR